MSTQSAAPTSWPWRRVELARHPTVAATAPDASGLAGWLRRLYDDKFIGEADWPSAVAEESAMKADSGSTVVPIGWFRRPPARPTKVIRVAWGRANTMSL